MPFEVIWSDKAIGDIDSLAGFIAQDNPPAAGRYIAAVYEKCKRLGDFPESGRAFDAKHRVIVVRNHLVIYKFDQAANEVRIVTIVDGRRDISKLIENF